MKLFICSGLAAAANLVEGISVTTGSSRAEHASVEEPNYATTFAGRVLYMTSTFPGDLLPIDIFVEHQLGMLGVQGAKIRTSVMDNHPPWRTEPNPHAAGITALKKAGIHVVSMDYKDADDKHWLDNFWHVEDKPNRSLNELFGTDPNNADQRQKLSNFFVMQTFLNSCQKATDVELCVYLDPDILIHQNSSNSIWNLVAGSFAEHTDMWVTGPPYGCMDHAWWGTVGKQGRKQGNCFTNPSFVSSRHMIVNRTRMLASLPFVVRRDNHIETQYHEATLTTASREAIRVTNRTGPGAGQIMCGSEFFMVHPPGRFQKKHDVVSLRDMIGALAAQAGKRGSRAIPRMSFLPEVHSGDDKQLQNATAASAVIRRGTEELVRRFEARDFVAGRDSIWNDACGCCADMLPSYDRIGNGLAFSKKRADANTGLEARVNDATFEWMLQCNA